MRWIVSLLCLIGLLFSLPCAASDEDGGGAQQQQPSPTVHPYAKFVSQTYQRPKPVYPNWRTRKTYGRHIRIMPLGDSITTCCHLCGVAAAILPDPMRHRAEPAVPYQGYMRPLWHLLMRDEEERLKMAPPWSGGGKSPSPSPQLAHYEYVGRVGTCMLNGTKLLRAQDSDWPVRYEGYYGFTTLRFLKDRIVEQALLAQARGIKVEAQAADPSLGDPTENADKGTVPTAAPAEDDVLNSAPDAPQQSQQQPTDDSHTSARKVKLDLTPDIILLHLGTNDLIEKKPPKIRRRMAAMQLEKLVLRAAFYDEILALRSRISRCMRGLITKDSKNWNDVSRSALRRPRRRAIIVSKIVPIYFGALLISKKLKNNQRMRRMRFALAYNSFVEKGMRNFTRQSNALYPWKRTFTWADGKPLSYVQKHAAPISGKGGGANLASEKDLDGGGDITEDHGSSSASAKAPSDFSSRPLKERVIHLSRPIAAEFREEALRDMPDGEKILEHAKAHANESPTTRDGCIADAVKVYLASTEELHERLGVTDAVPKSTVLTQEEHSQGADSGVDVVVLDQHSEFNYHTELHGDGLHPSTTGEHRIAKNYYAAIDHVLDDVWGMGSTVSRKASGKGKKDEYVIPEVPTAGYEEVAKPFGDLPPGWDGGGHDTAPAAGGGKPSTTIDTAATSSEDDHDNHSKPAAGKRLASHNGGSGRRRQHSNNRSGKEDNEQQQQHREMDRIIRLAFFGGIATSIVVLAIAKVFAQKLLK